jgi:hypothetical protein
MCAWKAHDDIDFNFADLQLDDAIDSEDEYYIKRRCREKIVRSDTRLISASSISAVPLRFR